MSEVVTSGELRASVGGMTDSRLKRLRRAGLLPAPTQRHQVGQVGSASLYPAWTVEQLQGIARLRAEGARAFTSLRFLAWETGLWVKLEFLRRDFADEARRSIKGLIPRPGDPDADDKLSSTVRGAPSTGRHPFRSLHPHKSESIDLVTAVGQKVAHTPHAELADEGLDEYLPTSFLAQRVGEEEVPDESLPPLSEAVDDLELPHPNQWPRILERALQPHFDFAWVYLATLKEMAPPEEPLTLDGTSKRAISNRMMTAIPILLLARTSPEHGLIRALRSSIEP